MVKNNNKIDEETVAKTANLNVQQILKELPKRDRQILSTRLGLENGISKSYEQASKELDISKKDIIQIEIVSLRKLRHPSKSRRLRPFLSFMDQLDYSDQLFLKVLFGSDWRAYKLPE